MDPLRPIRKNVRRYRGIPSARPAAGTLFRSREFGKRTGRGSPRSPRGGLFVTGRNLAMVAHRLWPPRLRSHDAIDCARRNARRPWFSNSFLEFFRQHSWHAPKMSLFQLTRH